MSVIPIYNAYHPVLREKTVDVTEFDENTEILIDNMWETLYNISNGVGLAGNQVGEKKSVIIIDIGIGDENANSQPITLINPKITSFSDETNEILEGCLSIPDFFEKVKRPSEIEINYYDENFKEQKIEVGGFLARVIQHEVDHLNGVLFFDRLTPLRRTLSKSKLRKIENGRIIPNYPMIQANGELTQ
jgi:peptide deformylase